MLKYIDYTISSLRPYINWLYFYHAWGLAGKPQEEKERMRKEADAMLDTFERRYHTHAVFGVFDANSDGDDLIINGCLCCASSIPLRRESPICALPTLCDP